MFRKVRTTNERRQYDDWDGLIYIRPRRRHRSLVNSYDDISRGDYGHKCWKRHRRTQYKIKSNESINDSAKYASHMALHDTYPRRNWRRMYTKRQRAAIHYSSILYYQTELWQKQQYYRWIQWQFILQFGCEYKSHHDCSRRTIGTINDH